MLAPKLGAVGGGVTAATLAAAFVAVAGMSAGTIWQKRFCRQGRPGRRRLLAICRRRAGRWRCFSAAFETQRFTLIGELVFAMAWLVLVLSIGAIFLLMVMIRDGEMSKVASFFYLVPAVTAIIAWLMFGETLSLVQIGGMALATFGVGAGDQARTGSSPGV